MTAALAVALLALGMVAADGPTGGSAEESIEVKVRGRLRAGIVAIGAETTGYTVSARGVTWELEFGANEALREKAERLDGKNVIVVGSLESRRGVEIAMRSIVTVTSLEAAKDVAPAAATSTPTPKKK